MKIKKAMSMSYSDIRSAYNSYLHTLALSTSTIATSTNSAFYLWQKRDKDRFWSIINADNFEHVAREAILSALKENSSKNAEQNVNSYMAHLRRFRRFLAEGTQTDIVQKQAIPTPRWRKVDIEVPAPSVAQVEHYLHRWDVLDTYHLQENALDRLFLELCPENTDILDVLLKTSTLNDFYSTNIFSIFPVAKHIVSLNIDSRLKSSDLTLVSDIQRVMIGDVEKNFYSFATKYCSHHNPTEFPIYDSYVDEVLRYFRNRDKFEAFNDGELKDYKRFRQLLISFRSSYHLNKYSLKQIDKYLWQLGKRFFPKKY